VVVGEVALKPAPDSETLQTAGTRNFLPLVEKLEIIRYPFSSSVFHPFSVPRNRDRSDGMHNISVIIFYFSYVIS